MQLASSMFSLPSLSNKYSRVSPQHQNKKGVKRVTQQPTKVIHSLFIADGAKKYLVLRFLPLALPDYLQSFPWLMNREKGRREKCSNVHPLKEIQMKKRCWTSVAALCLKYIRLSEEQFVVFGVVLCKKTNSWIYHFCFPDCTWLMTTVMSLKPFRVFRSRIFFAAGKM